MSPTKDSRQNVIQDELLNPGSLPNIILNRSPHFIGIMELQDLTLIQVSDHGLEMFGAQREYANGMMALNQLFYKRPDDNLISDWKKNLEKKGNLELVEQLVGRNGKVFWGAIRIVDFRYEECKYYLVTISDVTALREMEEAAIRENERFAALFNNSTIGILVTNLNGEIEVINPYAESQFGYSEKELIGKKIEVLIPPEFTSRHVKHRQEFTSSPHTRPMGIGLDLFGLRKDGSRFPVEVSLSHYTMGGSAFVIAFINDITVRKENENAIRKQQDDLRRYADEVKALNQQLEHRVEERTLALKETLRQLEKNRQELSEALEKEKELSDLKSRFVAMASHEFRTPLSTILSSAALIDRYPNTADREKRERHIVRIRENVKHLTDILEDFLSLEKLEEGLVHSVPHVINVKQLLQDVVHDMIEVRHGQQQILYKHEGDEDFAVDKHLLRNIVINLLSNAIKFSRDDGKIEVNSTVSDQRFSIRVRDYGIGISEEDRQHLFDRFFRGKNATNIKGTGLGLHIVSKYLELLKGTIECTSELNEGTTFTIHLTTGK